MNDNKLTNFINEAERLGLLTNLIELVQIKVIDMLKDRLELQKAVSESQSLQIKNLRSMAVKEKYEKKLHEHVCDGGVITRNWNYYYKCTNCNKIFACPDVAPNLCDECPVKDGAQYHITYLGRFYGGTKKES